MMGIMKSKGKSRRVDSEPEAAEGVSSDEWFVRYLLDALLLVVLLLAAMGVALYLDGSACLRDESREPGAGFLTCLLLCPILGLAALGLVIYAGVRLFLRPRTLGHAFIRLTFLLAYMTVLFVCTDTISSTATAVLRGGGPLSGTDPLAAWRAIADEDFSGPPADERGGPPDDSPFSPPSGMGGSPLFPGGGPGSR
jgi:hypothetical protein